MYQQIYDYGDPNEQRPSYPNANHLQSQQGRSFVPYSVPPYQRTEVQEASPTGPPPPGSSQTRSNPGSTPSSYDYLSQQQQQTTLVPSLTDITRNGSPSSYSFRQETSTLSPQSIKQQQSQQQQQQQEQSSYNTLREYNYSSMGTQDIVTPQQQPQTNDPQVYNPIDISSIVHGSGVPNELPTTLPPLNSSILSTPHSTTQGSPIRNDHSQLSQGTAPLGQYQQQSGTTASCIAQQDYDQQQQQQQQEFTPGLSPYGCGIHGCFANFPLSSGLFYHMKSAAHHMDGGGNGEKPYRCAMPGCTKRYKNINGLQYHLREAKGSSGHGIAPPGEDIGKNYRCDVPGCKKAYRTANGLRYHQTHSHSTPPPPHQQQQQQQQQSSSPTIVNRHYPSLVLQQQLQQNDQSSSSVLNRHYHASPGLQQQTSPLPSRSHLQQSQQQQHPMTNLTYQQQQQLHRHQQEQLRSTQGTDGF